MMALDFFFPKVCVGCKTLGSYLCSNCFSYLSFTTTEICLLCGRGSFDGLTHPYCKGKYTIDGAFSSIKYERTAKRLIYAFKYKPYVTDLQSLLGELLYEGLLQKELFVKHCQTHLAVFVPIPLHKRRLQKRGYNQADILAKILSEKFGIAIIPLLKRVKHTNSQVGLSAKERKENIQGAFAIKENWHPDMSVFLVDDVLTTGSTLLEAASVLKKNGCKKVYGVTLARGG